MQPGRHFVHAVNVDDRTDATADTLVATVTLESGIIRVAEHHLEMPARRAADQGNLCEVDVVFFSIGPEPADDTLAVLHGRWECQLVERRCVEMVILPLPALPRAALDEKKRRHRRGNFRWPVEVELQRVDVGVSVLDVLLQLDTIR